MYESGQIEWLQSRCGCFSASELHLLMSSSGKFTQGNISYLYKIQRERELGRPKMNPDSPALRFGRDNEPYAVEWLRANHPEFNLFYVGDVDKSATFVKAFEFFGATPDSFWYSKQIEPVTWDNILSGEKDIVEIKCVYGDTEENYIFSPTVPFEDKKSHVKAEHGDQIAGQFIAFPGVSLIFLLKYLPQNDMDDFDFDSPLDPRRGIIFKFTRDEFDLDYYKKRIIFAHNYLESRQDLEKINEAWQELIKKEKEDEKAAG